MFKKILLVGSLLGLAGNAWALPFLEGSVAFSNLVGASWTPTGGTGISDATGIIFNGVGGNTSLDGEVTSALGSFAGSIGEKVDFHDFTFNPLGGQPTLWSFSSGVTNYVLKMTSTDIFQNSSIIALSGSAILTANGYEDTNGSFSFTANGNGQAFSYSSGTAVPEPASLALFGIGILGMAFPQIRRREENS